MKKYEVKGSWGNNKLLVSHPSSDGIRQMENLVYLRACVQQ